MHWLMKPCMVPIFALHTGLFARAVFRDVLHVQGVVTQVVLLHECAIFFQYSLGLKFGASDNLVKFFAARAVHWCSSICFCLSALVFLLLSRLRLFCM